MARRRIEIMNNDVHQAEACGHSARFIIKEKEKETKRKYRRCFTPSKK
jgi:hypothetical protein